MLFAVGFDQGDLFRLTARKSQVRECLGVDREEAHRRTILGGHVGDGCSIGDAQAGETRAVEFDKLSDHAFLAQHLCDRQHQIGGGCALAQAPVQAKTDNFRNEHRGRLAEHGGFGFDAANAPAEHTERVHHRGVRVGAHHRIGVSFPAAAVGHRANDPGQVFEVDLVADPRIRRHDFEILKRGLSPAQKSIALDVAPKFQFGVQTKGVDVAEVIHLHGMVDDQFGREERIDALGVAAHFHKGFAHGGKIHDRGYAGEVLEQHARRHESNLFLRRAGLPARQSLNILGMHEAAVFEAKQVFKKNAQREGKLCEFGDALVFEEFEAVNLKRLGADVELVTAAEGVSRVDGHPGDPFAPGEQLSIIAEIASARRGLY